MRVLVLHTDIGANAPPEELDTLMTSRAIAETLRSLGHAAALAPFVPSPGEVRAAIDDARADIVFNMVESVFGYDGLASVAPAIFEKLGVPFTGSSAATIALAGDKPLAKRTLRAAGLPTPDWLMPPDWIGCDEAARYIVKSATEDASLGLDDDAVVTGSSAIAMRMRTSHARYGGRWFAERYVEGREFNVAMLEKDGAITTLPVPEMRFENWPDGRPRIVGYRAKWDAASTESENTVRGFGLEQEDAALASDLIDLAQRATHLFDLRGYARVDFRVDQRGRATILEVNPNPSLDPEAGFAAAAARSGLAYGDLIAHILDAACRV